MVLPKYLPLVVPTLMIFVLPASLFRRDNFHGEGLQLPHPVTIRHFRITWILW